MTRKKLSKKVPNKVGRPTKYKKEYCEMLVAHMAEGYSFETFAAKIDVNRDTLYDWTYEHGAFSDAKKRGEVKSQEWYETVGRAMMTGKLAGSQPSVWIFSMKNKFNWTDKKEVDHTNSDGKFQLNYKIGDKDDGEES